MGKLTQEEKLHIVEENIEKIKNKEFNVFFFVLDTKGNPSGSLEYIYQTAMFLHNKGYKVTMLHQEKDFVGVNEWLGDAYAALPHRNIETENVEISPSDFLFIPEIFSNVMTSTKSLPCKRVIILQNYNYFAEYMPVGATPFDLKIGDIVTTTKVQEGIIKSYFPEIKTHVVSPSIQKRFRNSDAPRKLVVNIIARDQHDINKIMKPFYWKYPIYKWISFRDLRGLSQDAFCEALREAAITIWCDPTTNFGYSALEALRCGTIVLAKTTDTFSDWNVETDENGESQLTDACIWFEHVDDVPEMLASIIRSWTLDKVPDYIYEKQAKFNNAYSLENQGREIERAYEKEIFEQRLKDFEQVHAQLKNKVENTEE